MGLIDAVANIIETPAKVVEAIVHGTEEKITLTDKNGNEYKVDKKDLK